jgi:hypothetical protein
MPGILVDRVAPRVAVCRPCSYTGHSHQLIGMRSTLVLKHLLTFALLIVAPTFIHMLTPFLSESINTASLGSDRGCGLLKQSQGLSSELTQVLLVRNKLLQIDNLLVKEHTSDLSGMIPHHGLDARIDRVSNYLLLIVKIGQGIKALHVDLGERNLGVLGLALNLGSLRGRLLSRNLLGSAGLRFSSTTLLIAATFILPLIGASSHKVHLQVVKSALNKSLHLLLIFLLSFISQVNSRNPKLDLNWRRSERSALVQSPDGSLSLLHGFKEHKSMLESAWTSCTFFGL